MSVGSFFKAITVTYLGQSSRAETLIQYTHQVIQSKVNPSFFEAGGEHLLNQNELPYEPVDKHS
jgi:hypothetical protein